MRRAKLVNSLNKGVLDEDLIERIDLSHYHAGMRIGRNVEPVPQSGVRRRDGTDVAIDYHLRGRIEPVAVTESMLTAHNGGVKATLIDQNAGSLFVTTTVVALPFVAVEVTFPSPTVVSAVDVVQFSCERNSADNAISVEFWTGAAWQPVGIPAINEIGPNRDIRTTPRTRRYAFPPGVSVATQSLRLVAYAGAGAGVDGIGAISIGGIAIWRERADRTPNVRLVEFARDAENGYVAAITDRNIDLFDGNVFLGSLPLPVPGWRIPELNVQQSMDTLFVYAEDLPTPQYVRQGARDEWNYARADFINVPNLTANQTFSSSADEVQDIVVPLVAGDVAVAFLGELKTAPLTFASPAAFAAALAAGLSALPGAGGAGAIEVLVIDAVAQRYRVTFKGVSGSRAWPLVDLVVLQPSMTAARSEVVRRGLNASGPVMDDTTGWPRCGTLFQGRHWLGGFRAAPQTILASKAGTQLNYHKGSVADEAIMITFDTNQVETVRDIFAGRHLQVFTERGEWWCDNRTFDATQPINFILATRHGSSADVQPVFADNATLYVQPGGSVLREMQYVDAGQNYESTVLSLLSSAIAREIVDMAYRPARIASEPGRLYCVRSDGLVAHLSLNKQQEIIAWSLFDLVDPVRAVLVTTSGDVNFVIESGGKLWMLKRNQGTLTDATIARLTAPSALVTGLGLHEGREVWAIADNELYGPFTVAAGQITLPVDAAYVAVGRDFPVDIEPMPIRDKLTESQPFRPPARIYALDISVKDTGVFELATNQDDFDEVDPRYYDQGPSEEDALGLETSEPPDAPMLTRLVTGVVRVDGCSGITRHPRWRIRQRRPTPLYIRSLRLELAMQG